MCKFSTGKYYNCDLNAAYNIGARYFMIDESMPLALFSGYRRCSKVPDERKPDAENELTQTGDGSVAYASDNTSVATVDSTGKVTIKGAGTATITATVTDSDNYTYVAKTTSYTLTVKATNAYTVTFNANGQGTAPEAQTVAENATATKPADPTAAGYTFGGWYTEAECTNAYDFGAAVTADITLYAKWTKTSSGSTTTEVVPKTPDTPVPTVTGMEAVASAVVTAEEQSKIASGEINVDVKLEAEKKDEAASEGAQEIKNLVSSGNSVTMFLDLSLFKYVTTNATGSTASNNIGSANSVALRVQIPYDTARQNIQILRYHNAIAQAFTKLEAEPTEGYADGTYFVGNGFVALYASGFSTYAIADSGYAQTPVTPQTATTEVNTSSRGLPFIPISYVKHQKNRIKVAWKPIQGAEGYDIFASYTNMDLPKTPVLTGNGTQAVIQKVYGKSGLKKVTKDCIQYVVRAYKTVNGQKVYVAETHKNFTVGKGGSYSDAKKVTTKRSIFTIPVGKQINLNAKIKTYNGKKQVKKSKAIKYVSSDVSVAVVSKNGKVGAVGKGSCYIYVTAANGLTKTVLINVN